MKARTFAAGQPRRCKIHPICGLLLLGVLIIALEVLVLCRRLYVPYRLRSDLPERLPTTIRDAFDLKTLKTNSTTAATTTTTVSKKDTAAVDSQSIVKPKPDGTFNGYPIYYRDDQSFTVNRTNLHSQYHCIGETNSEPELWKGNHKYFDMNWMTRSCHFQFLCFDTEAHDYVIFLPESSLPNNSKFESQQTVFTNQSAQGHPFGVSIGSINNRWTIGEFPRLQWFPRVIYGTIPSSFYALEANTTLIPFHSLAAFNPGHLLWDDFLPIYVLMEIFQLHLHAQPLLIRHVLSGDGLWAGCDWRPDKGKLCEFMMTKFGPLMMSKTYHGKAFPITTQHATRLELDNSTTKKIEPRSKYVCAKQGVAGLGTLNDHGPDKGHGWNIDDYKMVFNQGRGGQFWRFRNHMLTNLGLLENQFSHKDRPQGPPYRIIFSESSSRQSGRLLNSLPLMQGLKNAGLAGKIEILRVIMKDYSLREQAEMVQKAAIYVTVCGGGAATAAFLPQGASLFVYYQRDGGMENNRPTGKPARLDWDYLNNMGYTRVHWMPMYQKFSMEHRIPTKEDIQAHWMHLYQNPTIVDTQLFVEMVKHDLDLIQAEEEELKSIEKAQD